MAALANDGPQHLQPIAPLNATPSGYPLTAAMDWSDPTLQVMTGDPPPQTLQELELSPLQLSSQDEQLGFLPLPAGGLADQGRQVEMDSPTEATPFQRAVVTGEVAMVEGLKISLARTWQR